MSDVPTHPQTTVVTDLVTDGANEVQTITLTGLDDGRYSVSFDGETTVDTLVAATTAAQLQTALENTSAVEPGDVAVTGDAGGPFTLTFGGQYAKENVPAVTVTATKGSPVIRTITAGAPDVDNPDAVQRGTGNADRESDTSPLDGLTPAEYRAANGSEFGDA